MGIKEEVRRSIVVALWLLWGGLILGSVAWAIIRCAELSGAKSSDIAAWVQAVGSIAAIVAAGAIANWQMRESEKRRQTEVIDKKRASAAVVQSSFEWAKALGDLAEQGPPDFVLITSWKMIHEGHFDAALMSLKAINAHELGTKDAIVGFFGVIGAMQSMRATMAAYALVQPTMDRNMEVYESLIAQGKLAEHAWQKFQASTGI